MATNLAKKHLSYTIKDIYQKHRSARKKQGVPLAEIMPYKRYRKIIEDVLQSISLKIIHENFTFIMPYNLGSIYVKAAKTDPRYALIDYNNTKKYGKAVRFLNRHTFGYHYGIWWNRELAHFKNRAFYVFSSAQSEYSTRKGVGRHGLSKHIMDCSTDPLKRTYLRL